MSPLAPSIRLLPALILAAALLAGCDREDPASLLANARTLAAAGDQRGAMIQLKNAVAQDEKNAEARFELGKLYLDQRDPASAEKEFRRAREAGYPAAEIQPVLMRALLGQGEFQQVLDQFPAEVSPENTSGAATLQALRASAELGLGRKEDARRTIGLAAGAAPANADVHLTLAQLALLEGNTDAALLELDQVLRLDPVRRDALLLKGDVLRRAGKLAEAAVPYQKILKLDARHTPARIALAEIALADGQFAQARKQIDTALKSAPADVQARYAQAFLDFRESKLETARDRTASLLKDAPGYLPALLLGGTVEYAGGNLQTAETYLNKVLKAAPGQPAAVRLLAACQLRLGRPEEAARTLAPLLKSGQVEASTLMVAGEIARARKNFAEASAFFEQAAQLEPDSGAIRTELGISRLAQGDARAMADLQAATAMKGANGRANVVIILDQLKKRQFEQALASIATLEKQQGADPLTWSYRAAAYLGKEDVPQARNAFEQALKLDPAFFPAAMSLAQLDLKQNQPGAAQQRFQTILKTNPKHLNAMLALADLAQRQKDTRTQIEWLNKAVAVNPRSVPPRVALARHWLTVGKKAEALAAAREALNIEPNHPAALDVLGTAQLGMGDTTNALATYQRLVQRQPKQATPLIRLAAARLAAGDAPGARTDLQQALHAQPDAVEAQFMLGQIDLQNGRIEDAARLAQQIQKRRPNDPVGFVLEGDTAYASKNLPAALAAYEKAHVLSPSAAGLARQLKVFSAMQRAEDGEKRLATWLQAQPNDARIRALLAESLLKRGQYKAAAAHYLILNRQQSGNLVVLNNLAWALLESGDRRALEFATQALKLQPDNPAVLDTHGWTLTRMGKTAEGLESLTKAMAKAPDVADINWHFAYALHASGNKVRARRELKILLDRGEPFAAEREARRLYQQLVATP